MTGFFKTSRRCTGKYWIALHCQWMPSTYRSTFKQKTYVNDIVFLTTISVAVDCVLWMCMFITIHKYKISFTGKIRIFWDWRKRLGFLSQSPAYNLPATDWKYFISFEQIFLLPTTPFAPFLNLYSYVWLDLCAKRLLHSRNTEDCTLNINFSDCILTYFSFVWSWFLPWQKSCLTPSSSSSWNIGPTGSSGAAQAPWESDRLLSTAEGCPVLEEPFKQKTHARFNTAAFKVITNKKHTVSKILASTPGHNKHLVSFMSREHVKSDLNLQLWFTFEFSQSPPMFVSAGETWVAFTNFFIITLYMHSHSDCTCMYCMHIQEKPL